MIFAPRWSPARRGRAPYPGKYLANFEVPEAKMTENQPKKVEKTENFRIFKIGPKVKIVMSGVEFQPNFAGLAVKK